MKKTFSLASMLALATAALVGCGGGGGGQVLVAPPTATVAASPTVAAAVVSTPFAFPTGVPSFGTTSTTTLSFTDTAATPAFSIASGGNTASGTTTFGSCDFKVTASTFPAGSPLALGQIIVVNPCNIKVNTSGQTANGQGQSQSIALFLGAAASAGVSVSVGVNPGGELTLNGKTVGTVTLTPLTGG